MIYYNQNISSAQCRGNHLLDLVDYTSYTIKTKILDLFIPTPSIVDISAVGYRNATTTNFSVKGQGVCS